MKKIFYILIALSLQKAWSQQITPSVLNSAGYARIFSFPSNPGVSLSLTDNIGEAFTASFLYPNATVSNSFALTQGFIQPEDAPLNGFSVTATVVDLSCNGKNDGKISTAVITTAFSYKAQYFWKPASLCPTNNCTEVDSLKAGSYGLTVVFTYVDASDKTQTVTVVADNKIAVVQDLNGPCRLKVFTGITMNNDGQNDRLYIENISEFPNNTVTIFNRWGAQLYQQKGYDGITKYWPTPDEESKLVPSTYFYVIDPGNGDKPVKGWVEIIKN